jgi:subtilisin family serine protease
VVLPPSRRAPSYVGIAKRANLIAVRVLGCSGSGSTAGVIRGIEWAATRPGTVRRARPTCCLAVCVWLHGFLL